MVGDPSNRVRSTHRYGANQEARHIRSNTDKNRLQSSAGRDSVVNHYNGTPAHLGSRLVPAVHIGSTLQLTSLQIYLGRKVFVGDPESLHEIEIDNRFSVFADRANCQLRIAGRSHLAGERQAKVARQGEGNLQRHNNPASWYTQHQRLYIR